MSLYTLRFAWWNVALTPPKSKTKGTKDNYDLISSQINKLISAYECSLIGLCEVTSSDLNELDSRLINSDFEIFDLVKPVGQTYFDLGLIYNAKLFSIEIEREVSVIRQKRYIKSGIILNVRVLITGDVFKIVLCHWPSRILSEGNKKRKIAADGLRDEINQYLEAGEKVIVMGDFNENPYNETITENLGASRCHSTVIANPFEFIYNPFWREMVSTQKHSYLSGPNIDYQSGSLRYREYLGALWHTYDQMMFSSQMIDDGDWLLNENNTKVIIDSELKELLTTSKCIVDHLPVFCELNKFIKV